MINLSFQRALLYRYQSRANSRAGANGQVKTLKTTIAAMKQTDEKYAEMFANLASLSQTKAEAESVVETGE